MRPSKDQERPLIEHCEGAEADDRAAVASAFLRVWRQQSKRNVTDLHCEQFIMAVFVVDRRGLGVQWSYEEIADRLRVSAGTARKVVDRCIKEFGIVAAVEERYSRGGQAANKYKIEWQVVRSINAGLVRRHEIIDANGRLGRPDSSSPGALSAHPGAPMEHPGVLSAHPGAPMAQPYKECPSITTSIQTSNSPLPEHQTKGRAAHGGDPWEVVVSVLCGLGMGDGRGAMRSAQQRGMTPESVHDWIARYVQLTAADASISIGHLHRWLTGRSRPPWLVTPKPAPKPQASLTAASTRVMCDEIKLRKSLQQQGKTLTEIDTIVTERMQFGSIATSAVARFT